MFFKQSINPVKNTHKSFTVFMHMLNVNCVCQVRVTKKNLAFIQTLRYNANGIHMIFNGLKMLWYSVWIRANFSIKTWVNIMKQNQQKWSEKYQLHKNLSLHFKENYTEIDDLSLVFVRFFFSQTNIVFEFDPGFISIFDSFIHNLFSFLAFDYWYSRELEIHPVSTLFSETSQIFHIFHKTLLPVLTAKLTFEVNSLMHNGLKSNHSRTLCIERNYTIL